MKYTLRLVSDTSKPLPVGTEGDVIVASDLGHAALRALDLMGLVLMHSSDLQLTTPEVEVLPNGMMTEENAAKYLGYSFKQLQWFRLRSKRLSGGNETKKCPRYFKKQGKIFYRKDDLDLWFKSADSERPPAPPPIWVPKSLRTLAERQEYRRQEKARRAAVKQGVDTEVAE